MDRSSLMSLAVALAIAASCPVASAQQRSAADIAQARELFNEGLALRDRGDADGALEKLKAAHALGGTPITGTELGKAYTAVGKLVEARETFLDVGRLPVQPRETARSKLAREDSARLADDLRVRLPSLRVKITGAPSATVAVTIDGAAIPAEALDTPRLVNPGDHEVSARVASGASADAKVVLKEGESREVELKIGASRAAALSSEATTAHAAPVPSPAVQPTRTPVSGGASPLVFVGFGIAAAGVATGSITGLMALSKGSAVKDACDGTTCPRSIDGDLKTGRTLGDVSTIAFAVGGVGAALGIVGLWLPRSRQTEAAASVTLTPWLAPGSAGVRGTF
jgi:hypothetical protein